MTRWPLVVFDLDGTLLDSLALTFRALDHAMARRIGRPLEIRDLMPYLRRTDADLIRMVVGADRFEATLTDYLTYYRDHPESAELFPGVRAMLLELKQAAIPSAIVTGRGRASLDIVLEQTGLSALVGAILAGDDGVPGKPSPDGALHVAARLGTSAAGGLMVGDGPDDILCGKAAGMITVAARWCGLVPLEQIHKVSPDHIVDSLEDLRGLIGL